MIITVYNNNERKHDNIIKSNAIIIHYIATDLKKRQSLTNYVLVNLVAVLVRSKMLHDITIESVVI